MARRAKGVLMAGRLIYLMGPSGSGKDTILLGLSRLMGRKAYLAPRLITRPETSTERGAISVSDTEFLQLERAGRLAMSWRANGLAYGVQLDIDDRLASGLDVLVNGSRGYLAEARKRYGALVPVLLTVDDRTLHQRLSARGREDARQIRERLDRNAQYAGMSEAGGETGIMVVDNSGTPEQAIRALYQYLNRINPGSSLQHAADSARLGQRPTSSRL